MPQGTIVEQLIIEIAGDSKKYLNAIKDVKRGNKDGKASMKDFAKAGSAAFLTVGASATALGVKATNAFKAFESGVTNVAKTTNLAGKELDNFKNDIILMSEEIPVTTDRLLEIATAAGQLGIKGAANLGKFTEVIAKLGATTNVEGEEAALTLARLLNITNESIDSVDKLGSALVDLGNNFAASEAEILEVSKDVAKATVQFGLASDEILGISAAMASLGIAAEAGGTVVGKAFQSINTVIRSQGGPAFDKLVELTQMTGDQLTDTFQTDAAAVFTSFIEGLGRAAESGKDTTKELQALGLSGIRVNKILPTMATRSDILADAMKRSGIAAKDASALNEEAAKQFGTANSKMIVAQNKLNNLFIEVGEKITPDLVKAIEQIVDVIRVNQPVISGLAESFSLVVTNGISLIATLQEMARRLRIVASGDEALKNAAVEYAKNEGHLNELLKERGITIEEFRKKQAELAADQKKSSAQSVKDAEKEAIAQAKRTATFFSSEADKTEVLTKATKVRKQIEKAATNEKIKADKKEKDKLLDQQLKADKEMFEEIEDMSDDVVAEYEDTKDDVEKISSEQWEALTMLQKSAYVEQIDLAIQQKIAMGDLEGAGDLERYKQTLGNQDRLSRLYKKYNGTRLKDEEIFGLKMSALTEAMSSDEMQQVKAAAIGLEKLINSENDTMKEIGKAATIIQMSISTAEGAMKAYDSLSWIPYVGQGLGIAAAAAVTAYGGEQISKVQAMKTGGVVPGVGRGDKVPAILEPGELVVPRDITKEILSEYGARKMAEGGRVVPGDQEKTDLHSTFANIFQVPQVFKAIFAGESGESETGTGGFGADAFNGMIPPTLDAIHAAVILMVKDWIKTIYKIDDPGDEIPLNEPLSNWINNAILDEITGPLFESDIARDLYSSPIAQANSEVTTGIGRELATVKKNVSKFFGFQQGGVVGMLSPGEGRISKDALKGLASGVNMSQNLGSTDSRPSVQRSSSTSQGGVQNQMIGVEISLNDNAAEVINAQLREGDTLGTLKR